MDEGSRGFCTIYLAKTKALISCAVTAQLTCGFAFAYAISRFSHDTAQFYWCISEKDDFRIKVDVLQKEVNESKEKVSNTLRDHAYFVFLLLKKLTIF